jgi:hypothetical protein
MCCTLILPFLVADMAQDRLRRAPQSHNSPTRLVDCQEKYGKRFNYSMDGKVRSIHSTRLEELSGSERKQYERMIEISHIGPSSVRCQHLSTDP